MNITIYTHGDIKYFIAREIAKFLGHANISQMVAKVSDENKMHFRDYPGKKHPYIDPRTLLISRRGLYEVVEKTRKIFSKKSRIIYLTNNISEKLREWGINLTEDHVIDIENKDEVKKNEEGRELTTYNYMSNHLCFEYYIGIEIATLVGYKNPNQIVRQMVSKCNQLPFKDYPGVKSPPLDPRTILITHDGACEILLRTRKLITPDVAYILKKFNIDITNTKGLCKEQKNLSFITNTFKIENTIPQYPVGPYFLDLYFPEYKLILECDEFGHNDRDPAKEKERVEFINKKLKITDDNWVRFNPDGEYFDIAKVVAQIYLRINKVKSKKHRKKLTEEERQRILNTKSISRAKMNIDLLPEKPCTYCNEVKKLEEFHIAIDHRDGRDNICKVCKKKKDFERVKKFREENELPTEKVCNICKEMKSMEDYYKDRNAPDCRMRRCKECHRKKSKTPQTKIVITEKRCTKCKVIKPVTNFHSRNISPDGFHIYCKECALEKAKKTYAKNKDKYLATKRTKRQAMKEDMN